MCLFLAMHLIIHDFIQSVVLFLFHFFHILATVIKQIPNVLELINSSSSDHDHYE